MSNSWKNRQTPRRPPLQAAKPKAEIVAASAEVQNRVPTGIELTPISPEIIQQVKDLLTTRQVDVESLNR